MISTYLKPYLLNYYCIVECLTWNILLSTSENEKKKGIFKYKLLKIMT